MKTKLGLPVIIIHFNPLERYPPVINLLNFLGCNTKTPVIIITTEKAGTSSLKNYENFPGNIIVKRSRHINPGSRLRLFKYLFFYTRCLYLLIKYRPKSVLYFETISSWPALLYKRLQRKKVNLLAHYHEYVSRNEYKHNMRLVKRMHQTEIKMYSWAYSWISQTNEVRLQKFIDDNFLQKKERSAFHIMPNYPSKSWAKEKPNFNSSDKTRLVYVGALGYDTMYLKELIEWVLSNRKCVSLDLYSDNIDDKAKDFLASITDDSVTFHGGCNYEELPSKLNKYDIGLVIYKPVSPNWIHNAPNKIFEYLACGLDVWFSETMTYTSLIARADVYPKIIGINFEKLDEFDIQKAKRRQGLTHRKSEYHYENVYGEISKALGLMQIADK